MMPAPQYSTRTDGIVVPARSIDSIAASAAVLRKHLCLEGKEYFPVVEVYEVLHMLYENGRFEVWETSEMGQDEGRTYPHDNLILLREDVYEGACDGVPRDRFTMCHELGHLMMHREMALSRIDPQKPPIIYCNSEWQADTFASHLMMPQALLANYSSVAETVKAFGVSAQAAQVRLRKKKA